MSIVHRLFLHPSSHSQAVLLVPEGLLKDFARLTHLDVEVKAKDRVINEMNKHIAYLENYYEEAGRQLISENYRLKEKVDELQLLYDDREVRIGDLEYRVLYELGSPPPSSSPERGLRIPDSDDSLPSHLDEEGPAALVRWNRVFNPSSDD